MPRFGGDWDFMTFYMVASSPDEIEDDILLYEESEVDDARFDMNCYNCYVADGKSTVKLYKLEITEVK